MKYLNIKLLILLIAVICFSGCESLGIVDYGNTEEDEYGGLGADQDTYTAEVPTRWNVSTGLDADGYLSADDGTDCVYYVNATMKYQLTFPRRGGEAKIARMYSDYEVYGINNQQNYSQDELSTMMSRTEFPPGIKYIYNMTFVKPPNEYGYFKWVEEGNEYRGNVVRQAQDAFGAYPFHIVFKTPVATFNQTYIIIEPEYPQWGGMANQ